jgi:hypothetical protein
LTFAKAFCTISLLVFETIAATLKIMLVIPLAVGSPSTRFSFPITDSITSLLPNKRSPSVAFAFSGPS